MPINPDLLIAAPMLQDALVDKDGTPMSAGTITCYQDNSRTTLKNWYYQSSNFADANGKYTFSPLPNPLTLSAAGTICDVNGVDTIPFFYPYSEDDENVSQPYYITIVNHAQTNQITRPNFPYNPLASTPTSASENFTNYIINNVFWRNAGTVNLTNNLIYTIAPSQHDTYQYPDIQFIKDQTGDSDQVSFTQFPLSNSQILTDDITPEYYLTHTTTGTPSSGATQKCYQFPITTHVNTLNGVEYTVTIQAQNAGGTGTGENVIKLFLLQDTGTGTTSPALIPITGVNGITLSSDWKKYTFTGFTPSTGNLVLSQAGDDALYLQIQVPLNKACTINFTKPSFYLGNINPSDNFSTYDQIDTIISSPRTGDLRTSLNGFSPYGWVLANDGTIGSASSGATTRANIDTWSLYKILWNGVSDSYAPVIGGRGVNAYEDWIANKPITLTKTLSRLIGTQGSGAGLTSYQLGQYAGAESTAVTLIPANLPPHTHQVSAFTTSATFKQGTTSGSSLGDQRTITSSTNGTGTTAPFNVTTIPPSVYYYVFFKL